MDYYLDYQPGFLYLRVFRLILQVKDTRRHQLLYSQRSRPHLTLGPYYICARTDEF